MTPEAARKKKWGQNANFDDLYMLKNSPKLKREGQKPPKIQNWGSFLQNVRLRPHIPF